MADTPTPPYDCPMPARYAQTPFDQLPPALQQRVLAAQRPAPPPEPPAP
jgi:hypothetical protein